MNPSKYRQSFVFCNEAHLAVYEFYESEVTEGADNVAPRDDSDPVETCKREVVLIAAGCANSVAIYTMLEERSLPDFLHKNGFNVWLMDLRGHGESEPPPGEKNWDISTYAFTDALTVIDYIRNRTGCSRVHWIGHSMGGMIGMALASHPQTSNLFYSVTALGSAVFLGSSIMAWFRPILPIVSLTGGIDVALHTKLSAKFFQSCGHLNTCSKTFTMASCGIEGIMASPFNTGSARTHSFMSDMFCAEPAGVFEDFAEGLKSTGLRLKANEKNGSDRAIQLTDDNFDNSHFIFGDSKDNEQTKALENGSSKDDVPINIENRLESAGTTDDLECTVLFQKSSLVVSPALLPTIAHQVGKDTTLGTDYIELGINLGRFFQRVLLLNGTEDQLVRPQDVQKTYEAICSNAIKAPLELGVEPRGGKPMMYTVGLDVGGKMPYAHFDLVFGEDAPNAVYPVILSFMLGNCEGKMTAL